jgi:hypothetical protein
MDKILTILRWIYALLFLLIGARSLLVIAGLLPISEYPGSPEARAFAEAIFAKGFISPLMSITFFVSGILIIIKRTAPFGLILLAPFILAILLTHLMFEPNPIFGILIALLWFTFALRFRKAFQPMWNYRDFENTIQKNRNTNE